MTAEDLASDAGIAALKQKLVGDFEVSLDDSALNELPGTSSILPQLENMAQHGYFTHDNGRWHATIHSANGQNSFNGKLFEPAALAPPAPPPRSYRRHPLSGADHLPLWAFRPTAAGRPLS